MLLTKYKRATLSLKETKQGYDDLTETLHPSDIQQWKMDKERAMKNRGEELKLFDVQEMKSSTQADIRLQLSEKESSNQMAGGTISWLAEGISLEQAQ